MMGPCAKLRVKLTLVTPEGEHIVGENWCANPQSVCPRLPGEGYEKCKSICQQEGHAEEVALKRAGVKARGAHAYLEYHTYACRNCQETMFDAGVVALSRGKPPVPPPPLPARLWCNKCGPVPSSGRHGPICRFGEWIAKLFHAKH